MQLGSLGKILKVTGMVVIISFIILTQVSTVTAETTSQVLNVKDLVRKAWNYWRDQSSYTIAEMVVHRPSWERKFRLKVWTKGSDRSLVFFTAPAKDAGTASLTIGDQIWTYSPKINRIIKIPPSMKNQSWMGSDFSYQDLSKSDDIVDQYEHVLVSQHNQDGQEIYHIRSIPHETAPVVWGREELEIRDDNIILEHLFYDQDGKLVKKLRAIEIRMLGGKLFPVVIRVEQAEKKDEWTEVTHTTAEFGIKIEDNMFSQSGLTNPLLTMID